MVIPEIKIDARRWIHNEFPYLRNSVYRITSPNDDDYNCIAWAAKDETQPWWPDEDEETHWPEGIDRKHTTDSFIAAFRTLGYEPCTFNPDPEPGIEKVVIYVDHEGKPQHMARQLETGVWTSKLGRAWDIEHPTMQGVECSEYGRARYMLSRAKGVISEEISPA